MSAHKKTGAHKTFSFQKCVCTLFQKCVCTSSHIQLSPSKTFHRRNVVCTQTLKMRGNIVCNCTLNLGFLLLLAFSQESFRTALICRGVATRNLVEDCLPNSWYVQISAKFF